MWLFRATLPNCVKRSRFRREPFAERAVSAVVGFHIALVGERGGKRAVWSTRIPATKPMRAGERRFRGLDQLPDWRMGGDDLRDIRGEAGGDADGSDVKEGVHNG